MVRYSKNEKQFISYNNHFISTIYPKVYWTNNIQLVSVWYIHAIQHGTCDGKVMLN